LKFIQIINEAKQVGEIYHYTALANALKIINDNELFSSHADRGFSISFTRDKYFLNKPRIGLGGTDIAFVIDGNKLSNNYKINPNKFTTDNVGNEQEERIQDIKKITNFKNYVKEVWIFKSRIEDYNDFNKRKMQDLISTRFFNNNNFKLIDVQKKFVENKYKVIIK
jgi:hypothetical protein